MNRKVTAGKLVVGNSVLHFSVPSSIQKSSTANYSYAGSIFRATVTNGVARAKETPIANKNWASSVNKVRVRSTYGAIPIK